MRRILSLIFLAVIVGFSYGEATLLGYVFKTPEKKTPIKGAVVKLQGLNGKIYFSKPTPADGSYMIQNIERGKYKISVLYKNREYKAVFTQPGSKPSEHPVLVEGGTLIISLALKPGKDLLAIAILGGAALTGGAYEFTTKEETVSPIK